MARGNILVTLKPDYCIWEATAVGEPFSVRTGVYLDPEGWMVATDGYILAAVPCKINGPLAQGLVIPARFLAAISETFNEDTPKPLALEIRTKGSAAVVSHVNHDTIMTTTPVRSAYPNWRNLIPPLTNMSQPHTQIMYNPALVTRLGAAIGVKTPLIVLSQGYDPSIVPGLDGAFGLLMPVYTPDMIDYKALALIASLRPVPQEPELASPSVEPEIPEDTAPG